MSCTLIFVDNARISLIFIYKCLNMTQFDQSNVLRWRVQVPTNIPSRHIVSEVSHLGKARAYNGVQDIVYIIAQTVRTWSEKGARKERNGNPPQNKNQGSIEYQCKSPPVEKFVLVRVVLCQLS